MRSDVADVAVLIVGYRNASDVVDCLTALSASSVTPGFDVFICENGGRVSYGLLTEQLLSSGVCSRSGQPYGVARDREFEDVEHFGLIGRSTNVWIARASSNLGYAGGINAWLRTLETSSGWKGIWVLNPDTLPQPTALAALVDRAETGGKAMVGSTILEAGDDSRVRFRGGLRWHMALPRPIAIGLGEPLSATHDLSAIETTMDSPSGASLYVTRSCINTIGLMDDSYFLFYEDIDWGVRAKALGLGYASESIVAHKRGTTTGSSGQLKTLSRLSVYLEHRNGVRFVRRHFPRTLLLRLAISCCYALRFLLAGSPRNFAFVFRGMLAGLRGETGRPGWYTEPIQ